MRSNDEGEEFVAQEVPLNDSGVFCCEGLNITVGDAFNFLSQQEVGVDGLDFADEKFVELLPQLGEICRIAAGSLESVDLEAAFSRYCATVAVTICLLVV